MMNDANTEVIESSPPMADHLVRNGILSSMSFILDLHS